MAEQDTWREDARTDRAIELLKMGAAKTDACGRVVPGKRYSRSVRHVAYELMWDIDPWGKRSVTLSREEDGGRWGMVCEIEGQTGWEQWGEAWSDEDAFSHSALAICRALLAFSHDDGEPMTPDEVIAMLERRHTAIGSGKAS